MLCGGTAESIKTDFETLVETGCAPKMACFECLHELKLIVGLIYEGDIVNMNYPISNNAKCGKYVIGSHVVTEGAKKVTKQCPRGIQTGKYAKGFLLEYKADRSTLISRHRLAEEHQIEQAGAKLHVVMPWIAKNRLVNQSKN